VLTHNGLCVFPEPEVNLIVTDIIVTFLFPYICAQLTFQKYQKQEVRLIDELLPIFISMILLIISAHNSLLAIGSLQDGLFS
jgi:hypothetical protein